MFDPAEVSMHSHPVIIPLCRHTFPDGRHCLAPAVRGRACCRHHLDVRTRLHNAARSRRLASFPRLNLTMDLRDVDLNRIEIMRVVNAGYIDFSTARMLLWSMDLAAATLPREPKSRKHRSPNPNVFYYKPIKHLFSGGCIQNPAQVLENTRGVGEGGVSHARSSHHEPDLLGT